jgi:hypothetical protein
MYARDVRRKIYRNRLESVHDWAFHSIPGLSGFAALAVISALMFKSPLYTIMVVGTAFFLLGNVFGERKGSGKVDQS